MGWTLVLASAAMALFSPWRPCPLAVGAVCRNNRPQNKTAQTEDCAEMFRNITTILGEKTAGGNSHLAGLYADHDSVALNQGFSLCPTCAEGPQSGGLLMRPQEPTRASISRRPGLLRGNSASVTSLAGVSLPRMIGVSTSRRPRFCRPRF